MGTIWQPPPGGYVDGPGLVCVGSLDTDPAHPWGRTNAWAYDGAIYGYREFADSPFGGVQYSVLGGQMSVCIADDVTGADKATQVGLLNAGCAIDPFRVSHVLVPNYDDDVSAQGWTYGASIYCSSDGGDTAAFIKASMAVWGIVRDVLTLNDLGATSTPLAQAYGASAGRALLAVQLQDSAASDLWQVLIPEVITLWNEH